MRNLMIIALFAMVISSCDLKEDYEVEKSKVVEAAGQWYVMYNHETFGEDPFGAGFTALKTFNTSDDNGQEIWLTDEGNFWDYKVKIPVNLEAMTFGREDTVINEVADYNIKVIVRNGKIIKNASVQPSGATTDSIYFEIWFEDLEAATEIANDKLLVSGFRRTGFLEDEH
ncbi:MAG TPA: lipid-binding protein [Prolixibacteraceae bacterium]|nr:lipid-binding protein [Prolixibacteraceae bacterium]